MLNKSIIFMIISTMSFSSAALGKERETKYLIDGNDLYSLCSSSNRAAIWFISGVLDGYERAVETGSAGMYCIPANAKTTQIIDLACNYVRNNPKYRHYSASFMVQQAMLEAWPCR